MVVRLGGVGRVHQRWLANPKHNVLILYGVGWRVGRGHGPSTQNLNIIFFYMQQSSGWWGWWTFPSKQIFLQRIILIKFKENNSRTDELEEKMNIFPIKL